jgi:hypothetical protein
MGGCHRVRFCGEQRPTLYCCSVHHHCHEQQRNVIFRATLDAGFQILMMGSLGEHPDIDPFRVLDRDRLYQCRELGIYMVSPASPTLALVAIIVHYSIIVTLAIVEYSTPFSESEPLIV